MNFLQRSKRSVALGSISPHVPSLRKVNNDQVAVGIDLESDETVLEDEDDDKGELGFLIICKSLCKSFFSACIVNVSILIFSTWIQASCNVKLCAKSY